MSSKGFPTVANTDLNRILSATLMLKTLIMQPETKKYIFFFLQITVFKLPKKITIIAGMNTE